MSVQPLRSLLAGLGLDPTPRELAEILWLATRLPAVAPVPADSSDAGKAHTRQAPADRTDDEASQLPAEQATPDSAPAIPVYARTSAASPGASRLAATPVRLAADPPLPRQLELLRALRPLKRRVPSRHVGELDEEATLEAMAHRSLPHRSVPHRRSALFPVLRPAVERWLDVVLVVDGHPTGLLLWTPLVREVHRLLVQLGAFRDVRLRYLHNRPGGSPGLSAHAVPHPERIRDTSEIHDPSGRRLVLVFTDGVAPGWQDPAVGAAMRRWATAGPLAVLQALPEGLWRRTALPAVPARLRRAPLSAANVDLTYTGLRRGKRELPTGTIPVPVLELSRPWLKPWAELVAGSGTLAVDAAVTLLDADPRPRRAVADGRSPNRRLQDFHATATPEAFRLLACLSAVPLTVAIMRVVQAAMLPGTPPTVLAEVMFSGLIAPMAMDGSIPPADVPHDFLPGVRAALLESLRTHEVDQVLREVSRYVEHGGAGAGRVSGLLPDPANGSEVSADGIPWALLREEAFVRAGLVTPAERIPSPSTDTVEPTVQGTPNPYRLGALITVADFSDVHLGVDADGNQAVVKVRPRGSELEPEAFQALVQVEAEALRRMDGRYAPPLLGIDQQVPPTWLAMGCVTSNSGLPASNLISRPWWGNGPSDDFQSLSQLARRLAEALDRAHAAGIVHGNLSPHAVLLIPDTVVLISWVYAQFDGRLHAYPQYREFASGYMPPEGYPRDEPLDPSFDIYGLGSILLYEATRDGHSRPGQRGSGSTRSPRGMEMLPSHLGSLEVLIRRCLDPDPGRRPTARQLVDDLGDLAAPRDRSGDDVVDPRGSWERMESLPGLDGLKWFLERMRAETSLVAEFRTSRDHSGIVGPTAPRMVFTGNPGTGKTTGARLVGETCRELGLLGRGHLVVVEAGDLVSEYVGQTAVLTDEAINRALDGVLFIDKVYRFGHQRGRFSAEAIPTLLRRMEADRARLAVILAGSAGNMREFLSDSPGLAHRFSQSSVIEFPDLEIDTLMTILNARFAENGLRLDEVAAILLRQIVAEMHRTRSEDFANGREMRHLADAVVRRRARRVGRAVGEPVIVDDIPESYRADLTRAAPYPSALLDELDDCVGLETVREALEDLADRLRGGRAWEDGTSPHLVFTGPPGTGKTTVARLVGRLFRDLGLLRNGHCVEVTRSDLVGSYVGQTASLVHSAVQNALDGVLFIDEAYSLAQGGVHDFGAEALDTLVSEMLSWHGRLVVIIAGQSPDMEDFLDANQVLATRFGTRVHFPEYDAADLVEIFGRMAAERGYTLGPGVQARTSAWLEATRLADPSGFANARTVSALLELMEARSTERYDRRSASGVSSSLELLMEDFPEGPDPFR